MCWITRMKIGREMVARQPNESSGSGFEESDTCSRIDILANENDWDDWDDEAGQRSNRLIQMI